jgi:hypothetical protein
MVTLPMLWLPILVSAVIVFIASNVLWMMLPFWHRKDYGHLANDKPILDVLSSTPSGQYMVPSVNWQKLTAEEKAAIQKGPGALLLVRNPMSFSFGSKLASFFIYNVVLIAIVGYLAARALSVGAACPQVFRVVVTAGILAYSFITIPDTIWYGKPWSVTIKTIIDGIIYGLLIAGTFGWLWPR